MKARSPVPVSKKDDLEDVAWALQTAEATWSRGEHADALKWIRRAAESASEAEADDRALELAKAAADVASLIADRATAVTPPAPQPMAIPAPRIGTVSKPPPPYTTAVAANPAPKPPITGATPKPPAVAGPIPPRFTAAAAPILPRPVQKGPIPARIQVQGPVSKRSGRRSSPSYTDEATRDNEARGTGRARASATNEAKKRARTSKPSADETLQGPPTQRHPSTDEIELWPTASLVGDDFDDDDIQHTRIGTPAYRETAKQSSTRPPAMGAPAPLVMSQAVRVVVWREADGVHVAPAGTQVTAISVEAVLVATDPGADLAAWLAPK